MELKEYRFDEVTDNFDKKRIPLSSAQRKKRQGKYRYYGAQGVIDHIDDFIFDGTYLLIAEDGENLKSKSKILHKSLTDNSGLITMPTLFRETNYAIPVIYVICLTVWTCQVM